jgi:hypothetical protein
MLAKYYFLIIFLKAFASDIDFLSKNANQFEILFHLRISIIAESIFKVLTLVDSLFTFICVFKSFGCG